MNVEQVLNTRCVESEKQTRQSTYSQVIAIQVQLGLITSNVQDLDCVPNEDVDLHLVVRGTREREVGGWTQGLSRFNLPHNQPKPILNKF